MDKHIERLTERPGAGRLGRHVEHDPRSRSYAVTAAPPSSLRDVLWHRNVPVFDQGDIGSCTGNAMAGALSTAPFPHHFHEPTAFSLYKFATHLDDIEGAWPTDTGSSGLAVAKAAELRGWIRTYRHAFSINAALTALQSGCFIAGTEWPSSFDQPDSSGRVTITPDSYSRGGHEYCAVAMDVTAKTIRFANSWGPDWGDRGYFTMDWSTFEQLLEQSGDVTVPIA